MVWYSYCDIGEVVSLTPTQCQQKWFIIMQLSIVSHCNVALYHIDAMKRIPNHPTCSLKTVNSASPFLFVCAPNQCWFDGHVRACFLDALVQTMVMSQYDDDLCTPQGSSYLQVVFFVKQFLAQRDLGCQPVDLPTARSWGHFIRRWCHRSKYSSGSWCTWEKSGVSIGNLGQALYQGMCIRCVSNEWVVWHSVTNSSEMETWASEDL